MRVSLRVLLSAFLLLGAGRVEAAERRTDKTSVLAGCYRVTIGDWSPTVDIGEDSDYRIAPQAVELTQELLLPAGTLDDWLIVRPINGSQLGVHRSAYWQALPNGSVAITFTNGHSGLVVNVDATRKPMVGVAYTFWDFPRDAQNAPARLERIECPAKRSNSSVNASHSAVTARAYSGTRPARGRARYAAR